MVAESIFVDDGEGGTIYRKTEEAEKIKQEFATNRELALEYFDKAYEALGGKKITVGYIYFDEQEDMKRTAEVAKEIYEGLFGTDRFELKLEAVLPNAAYDRYRAGTYDMGIGVRLCSPFNPYTSMAPWTTNYADKYTPALTTKSLTSSSMTAYTAICSTIRKPRLRRSTAWKSCC